MPPNGLLDRLASMGSRLGALGPGLLAGTAAVLLTINVMVIVLRRGEASPTFIASTLSEESSPPSAAGQGNDGAAAPAQPSATPASPSPTMTPSPSPSPTVTDTPSPTATVAPAPITQTAPPPVLAAVPPPEGSLPYVSSFYAIAYPASWSVQPEDNGDSFRQLGPSGPIRPTITVSAELLARDLTVEQYVEKALANTKPEVRKGTRALGPYQVGGARALMILVDQTILGQRVAVLQTFFTTPGVGWTAGLITSPDRLVRDSGTFLWMLDQFKLRQ